MYLIYVYEFRTIILKVKNLELVYFVLYLNSSGFPGPRRYVPLIFTTGNTWSRWNEPPTLLPSSEYKRSEKKVLFFAEGYRTFAQKEGKLVV